MVLDTENLANLDKDTWHQAQIDLSDRVSSGRLTSQTRMALPTERFPDSQKLSRSRNHCDIFQINDATSVAQAAIRQSLTIIPTRRHTQNGQFWGVYVPLAAISTMRSFCVSVPVVSRSIIAIGRDKIRFLGILIVPHCSDSRSGYSEIYGNNSHALGK